MPYVEVQRMQDDLHPPFSLAVPYTIRPKGKVGICSVPASWAWLLTLGDAGRTSAR